MERALSRGSGAPAGTGDAAVYLTLLITGLGIVVPTISEHLPFGAEATLGACFVAFSTWGIASVSWDNVVRRK